MGQSNRTLKQMISSYVDEDWANWDEKLPYVLLAYRNTEHGSTGCTPNLLFFGRECTLPVDLTFDHAVGATDALCPQQYVEWLRVTGQKTNALVKKES